MVSPNSRNATQYKLCKKYGKSSTISEPITNIYLTKDEYNKFSEMKADIIQKEKYTYEFQGHSFSINTFSNSEIITIEAEFESEDLANKCQLPLFVGEEVSSNIEYESASIAKRLNA